MLLLRTAVNYGVPAAHVSGAAVNNPADLHSTAELTERLRNSSAVPVRTRVSELSNTPLSRCCIHGDKVTPAAAWDLMFV